MVKNKKNQSILSKKIKAYFKEISSIVIFIIVFGTLVNFMLWSVWGLTFNLFTLIGYGILSFLIEYEVPEIIKKIK